MSQDNRSKDINSKDEASLSEAERKALQRANYESPITDKNLVGKLELLEERAVVNKERLNIGKVIATKHIRSKTVNVPVELVEEVLSIEATFDSEESSEILQGDYDDKDVVRLIEPTLDSTAVVTINGKQVELGDEPIEVVLSRQVAVINKETYVVQEVKIDKSQHHHQDTIDVELKREELDVVEEGFLDHKTKANAKK